MDWLMRRSFFQNLAKLAFEKVDRDKSGRVDKDELYTGMLLFHIELAAYVGAAAAKPFSREKTEKVFDTMDTDKSGDLCEEEFIRTMAILSSEIISRVINIMLITLFLVPLLTKCIMVILSPVCFYCLKAGKFCAPILLILWR